MERKKKTIFLLVKRGNEERKKIFTILPSISFLIIVIQIFIIFLITMN